MVKRIGFLKNENYDFVFSFLTKDIDKFINNLNKAESFKEFEFIAKHSFYIKRWIDDMNHFGYSELSFKILKDLEKKYKRKSILNEIYSKSLHGILKSRKGFVTLGENNYILHGKNIYYKSVSEDWYEVKKESVFLLVPEVQKVENLKLLKNLSKYKYSSIYISIVDTWQKKFSTNLSRKDFLFLRGSTTPDNYFNLSEKLIKKYFKNPPSFLSVKKLTKEYDDLYVENLIKVCFRQIHFVEYIRKNYKNNFILYLFRDGMMLSEVHLILDLLENKKRNFGIPMIGRKLLSEKGEPEKYWQKVVDALYFALNEVKISQKFINFSHLFKKKMKSLSDNDPIFEKKLNDIKKYLFSFVRNKKNILVVDTGMQGSVNMLCKYLIDSYSNSDVLMFVVSNWFKKVYKGKYFSEYYPMMRDIEILSRSEHVYSYKDGSFEKGKLEVKMGTTKRQFEANIELVVSVVVCFLYILNKKSNYDR